MNFLLKFGLKEGFLLTLVVLDKLILPPSGDITTDYSLSDAHNYCYLTLRLAIFRLNTNIICLTMLIQSSFNCNTDVK